MSIIQGLSKLTKGIWKLLTWAPFTRPWHWHWFNFIWTWGLIAAMLMATWTDKVMYYHKFN